MGRIGVFVAGAAALFTFASTLRAEDLYRQSLTQSLASDRRASRTGDVVTVVIIQNAQSSTSMQNGSSKSSALNGHIGVGRVNESADLSLGSRYNGQGEVRRTESFVTQMTASVTGLLDNGDLQIAGKQHLFINGERTEVEVRGRIRAVDIDVENRVPSNRIADAQINYNGKGFVSRSAKPGLVQRLFGILGIG